MKRSSRFLEVFTASRSIGPLKSLSAHMRSLSPGDKLIAGVFGAIIVVASLISVFTLGRSLMIEVPTRGGSLTEGMIGNPRFVNPLLSLSDADRDMAALTFSGLMGLGPSGTFVPVLAESYNVSDDGKVYTFVLRAHAQFSDGTPITADDVVFTIEKAQDPAIKSPEFSNWSSIKVKAVDARTVEFTLPKPYAPFLADTTLGILPAHLWRNIKASDFPFSPLMQHPVGSGPFKVTKVLKSRDGIITGFELSANTGFAPGRAYLDHMNVHFYTNSVELAVAYKSGKVQSAYGVRSPNALSAPYSRVFGVFFNQKEQPALARLEVRKALSISIDREHIVTDLLGGYASALIAPVPPGSGITEPALPSPSTRIADAKKVLTDAGWSFDETAGTWKNAKEKLSIDTIVINTSNIPELRALAGAVQADWQSLGVPTSLELSEPGDLTQSVIRPRAYQALLFGMVIGHGQDLYAFWDSKEQADPGLNIASYSDKTVDALLEKARTESDVDKARAYLDEANTRIAEDYPAAFTHAPDFLYAVPKTLYGVTLPQIAAPSDRFASVASWYRERAYIWPFLSTSP